MSVKRNLNRFFDDVRRKSEGATMQIAQEGLAVASTYTPVDTSVLINSKFRYLKESNTDKVVAVCGFNADYAYWVHEKKGTMKGLPRSDKNGTYWSPDAEPKFLVKGFNDIKPQIPKILKEIYAIK